VSHPSIDQAARDQLDGHDYLLTGSPAGDHDDTDA